ncbi:MAG: diguanylate cyclase, partial [Solirubrobacteraceae bacterium]|nr:diguanylate cyclase [Solirubrobacteraceae bacterium]
MTDRLIPDSPASGSGQRSREPASPLPRTTAATHGGPQATPRLTPPAAKGAPAEPMTAGRVPAAGASGVPTGRRSASRHIPVAGPMVLAGVLLVSSWVTVNWAIGSSRQAHEDARHLAMVSGQADALLDARLLGIAAAPGVQIERAMQVAVSDFAALTAALGELPDDPEVEGLRTLVDKISPAAVPLGEAVERGDLAEARRISNSVTPHLEALRAESAQLGEDNLARASGIEDVARIASGLALVGGSIGIGLVALSFSRLRQRALVERTRAEVEERTSTRLDALVSHATDAVMVLDPEGRITWISSTPSFPLSRSPQQAIGHFFTDLVHPTDRKRAAQAFTELLSEDALVTTSHLRLATAQGAQRPVEVRGENRLADPAIEGVILTLHDVSERTLLEDQLERLASRDPVTGVANRAQLEAHLQSAVVRRGRRGGFAGLLLVDLDDFRAVSDTLGHDAGDELLRHAARRLEQTAGDGDLVARLDGDTFAVLLDDLKSVGDGQARASAILSGLRGRAAVTGGHSVDLDAHGGLAFGAVDLPSREIIRHADIALLEAKGRGAKHVVSFTDQMRNRVTERVELTGDLRRATERDEFEVDYQPIVDIASGRTVGVEALARWGHPHRGRLSPVSFVDLAEQTGLIRPLGELILRQ